MPGGGLAEWDEQAHGLLFRATWMGLTSFPSCQNQHPVFVEDGTPWVRSLYVCMCAPDNGAVLMLAASTTDAAGAKCLHEIRPVLELWNKCYDYTIT